MLSAISIILNAITIIIFIVILGLVLKERKIQETNRDMVCNEVSPTDGAERKTSIKEEPMRETILNYIRENQSKLRQYFQDGNATQA